ncbi:helix-turn-helix domain-containing protein [Clostridioides sp. GD02377]|uniref:helix-turn-helix domain-containing protein n=1 Tax=unclassified Clostridioides TaxID=2635829 RepID=UPI0038A001F3
MEVDYKALGKRIKIARIKKSITQEAVSEKIDITPSHMSNIETAKTKVSLPVLINIANVLSVTVDELLCDNILSSKIIFEREAEEIFNDCDEYEVRMLVNILKYMKEVIREDREVRKQFNHLF